MSIVALLLRKYEFFLSLDVRSCLDLEFNELFVNEKKTKIRFCES